MKKHAESWQSVRSGGSDMRLFVVRPDTAAPAPAVMVLQEAFGVNAHIRDVATRIASLGYVAVAPDLFHRTAPGFEGDYENIAPARPHMEALTSQRAEEDLRATYGWLEADAGTLAGNIAAVGFCLGGKAAYIANGTLPIKAAVSYYGTGISSILQDYAEKQQAPLLMFWGGEDANADPGKRATIAETLHARNKVFTQVEFSNAGHGFFCDVRKAYRAHAAAESWAMLAMFLKRRLSVR